MGWICCFGGRKERVLRLPSDARARQRNKEKSSIQGNPPNLQSLGTHLKSAKEVCAYEELFQARGAVSGTPHGTKLFKRKAVRRTVSCGNSTAFKNGAKRLFDKNVDGRRVWRVDRLQEEVEVLRKRLAEEEEEARKLRNEVLYLRSCGVLQSPDRHRNSLSLEKESLLLKEDKGQRNSQSWLGLSLSPTSRFKLEEQLRCMAADELSKVPGNLTNGQKALIVATKLWQSQGDSHQQDYQTKRELVNSSGTPDCSHGGTSHQKWPLPGEEEAPVSNDLVVDETASSDHNPSPSKDVEQSGGNGTLSPAVEESDVRKSMDVLRSPAPSTSRTSREMEKFSFRPSAKECKLSARHLFPASSPRRDVPLLQRMSSCPERTPTMRSGPETEAVSGKCSAGRSPEKVKYESPKRSTSLPISGTGGRRSDPPDHVQARRFIDLKYQEVEEKLRKRPTKERLPSKPTSENSPPRLSKDVLPDAVEVPPTSTDIFFTEVLPAPEHEASSIAGDITSPSAPVMKPMFVCKSGRMWQPLSPVHEVDSIQTSVEDLERTSASQTLVSESVHSSLTSNHKSSSVGTVLSGSEWEQQESSPEGDDMSEVPDDDLFTLSPRRLHQSYNPWDDDAHRQEEDVEDERKTVLHVDSGSGTDLASSEETDLDDFVPIQCQSPAFSPTHNSTRNKFSKEKVLKVEEYARDKYFKDMGLSVEEFLSSSDSSVPNKSVDPKHGDDDDGGTETLSDPILNAADSPGAGKENKDGIEIPVVSLGQAITSAGPLKEVSQTPKKALIAPNDMTLSQDFDHPVLGSIENLPKWIECHGVLTGSMENREINHQDTHQDTRSERSTLTSDSNSDEGNNHEEVEHSPIHELSNDPDLKPKDDLPTLEFSVRQVESPHQAYDDLDEHARLRLSLHGFVYPDEHVLNLNHSRSLSMENLVQEQIEDHQQNETEIMIDELSHPGIQDTLDSLLTQFVRGANGAACLAEVEDHHDDDLVDSGFNSTSNSHVSTEQNSQQEDEKEKKMVMLDNDVRNDVLSHVQSLGYSIQIPKLRTHSFSGTEDIFESPRNGGDSEVSTATSRDGDDTFLDCESPTPSESSRELVYDNGYQQAETDSEPTSGRTSRHEEFPAVRRLLDISPDDRPILGTVATHWGENNDPKSLRQWDGLGIPNSTSKFKEDQRVNWHTTPFETRLEQALAKLPNVPKLCNERFSQTHDL